MSVDYGASVFAKLTLLSELEAADDVRGCGLWVDVDRAGSDKRMTVISWPRRGGRVGVSMAPPGSKDREPRFIPIEKRELLRALDRLRTIWARPGSIAGAWTAMRTFATSSPGAMRTPRGPER